MPKHLNNGPLIIDGREWKEVKVAIELNARSNFLISAFVFKNGGTKATATADLVNNILSGVGSIEELNAFALELTQHHKIAN